MDDTKGQTESPSDIPTVNQLPSCASCNAALSGPYCSQCGDERFTPEKRTLRYFFGNTVVAELFNFDGRIWSSLRLLMFRPGFLATEYALGRRRPYVNPLRILLVTIVIFAVTMTGTNNTLVLPFGDFVVRLNTIPSPMFSDSTLEGALQRSDPYGVIENLLEEKAGAPLAAIPDALADGFKDTLISLSTPLSFMVIVLLGLLLYLLFNRIRELFVDHLVFAMNYYSFVLITAMVSATVSRLWFVVTGRLSIAFVLLVLFGFGLWRFVYLAVAIRRSYLPNARRWRAWPISMGTAFLLLIFNAVCITTIQLACGVVAMWLLEVPAVAG